MAVEQASLTLRELLLLLCPNVYEQPPSNTGMSYPCIKHAQDDQFTLYADNLPYRRVKRYQLTVITEDVDDPLPDMVAALPMCRFDRRYPADQLYHTIYNIYF